jgi:predicted Zn-dependent protease
MSSDPNGKLWIERTLALSRADDAQVALEVTSATHLRFARSSPSTSGSFTDQVLTVRSTFGKKSAAATTNQLDEASLREVVERSERLARVAPENPEHMPDLEAQSYPSVAAHDDSLPQRGAVFIAEGSAACMAQARERDLVAAGYSLVSSRASYIGSRRGLFGDHRATEASFSETVRTSTGAGSGWAASVGTALSEVDYAACSKRAIDKALRSAEPKPLAPGKYVTILEPACVASLMQLLAFSMNFRSAEEGRNFFSEPDGKTKLGQQLFPESVSLRSDPASPLAQGNPWASDGLPQTPRRWIDNGRLTELFCERFGAAKRGREAVPPPSNLIMEGGSGSLDDLIASTKRGVLITSLWYIRFVDPKTLLLTGLTRDGVFWIENGKIAHPVSNFRWNDSPIRVLKNVEAMTASARTSPREGTATNIWVPALRVKEFELSSVSDAV